MTLINTTEESLRTLLFEHPAVSAFYHSKTCPICLRLLPKFKELTTNPVYEKLVFVDIEAEENPAANSVVKQRKIPFISIYHKGLLIECKTVGNGEEMIDMVNQLLWHQASI